MNNKPIIFCKSFAYDNPDQELIYTIYIKGIKTEIKMIPAISFEQQLRHINPKDVYHTDPDRDEPSSILTDGDEVIMEVYTQKGKGKHRSFDKDCASIQDLLVDNKKFRFLYDVQIYTNISGYTDIITNNYKLFETFIEELDKQKHSNKQSMLLTNIKNQNKIIRNYCKFNLGIEIEYS